MLLILSTPRASAKLIDIAQVYRTIARGVMPKRRKNALRVVLISFQKYKNDDQPQINADTRR